MDKDRLLERFSKRFPRHTFEFVSVARDPDQSLTTLNLTLDGDPVELKWTDESETDLQAMSADPEGELVELLAQEITNQLNSPSALQIPDWVWDQDAEDAADAVSE